MTMRVSLDKNDPGFARLAELRSDGYVVQVLLDDVELQGVITADEEQGEVLAHKYTPEGNIVELDGQFVYERLRGRVRIRVFRPNDTRVLH